MKNSNVSEYSISHDTLLITDAKSGVKRRTPKLFLECSMWHLYNEILTSSDYGALLGAIHADTNDVIISDTMLRSLAPTQIFSMIDHQKIMYGCAVCNT